MRTALNHCGGTIVDRYFDQHKHRAPKHHHRQHQQVCREHCAKFSAKPVPAVAIEVVIHRFGEVRDMRQALYFCLRQGQQQKQNPPQRQVAAGGVEPLLQAVDAAAAAATAQADCFHSKGERNVCIGGGNAGDDSGFARCRSTAVQRSSGMRAFSGSCSGRPFADRSQWKIGCGFARALPLGATCFTAPLAALQRQSSTASNRFDSSSCSQHLCVGRARIDAGFGLLRNRVDRGSVLQYVRYSTSFSVSSAAAIPPMFVQAHWQGSRIGFGVPASVQEWPPGTRHAG